MITVTTTERATGDIQEHIFKTELGAYSHIASMLHDTTNLPMPICKDAAAILTDKTYKVRQKRFSKYLFTVTR